MNADASPPEYDARYLAGILFFNRGDYFAAHEVWESIWKSCEPADRRFYQGLIHAAVAIYHACRGNRIGAGRLAGSADRYLGLYPPDYRGLHRDDLLRSIHQVLRPFLSGAEDRPGAAALALAHLELSPSPTQWPDPEAVLHATQERPES